MKRLLNLTLILVALLSLAACGGSAQPTTAPAKPAAQQQAQATAAEPASAKPSPAAAEEEATDTPEAAAPAAEPTTEDTLSVSDRDTGLDKLKSYTMRWQAQWTATDSGSTEKVNWDWTEDYTAQPEAVHWKWVTNDSTDTTKTNSMEMWQIGQTSYINMLDSDGKTQCMPWSSEDNKITKDIFSPSMLGSVDNAKYVGTEDVNGVKARHYKYDTAIGLATMGKVSGEMWVAVDGGFVVKDTFSWTGGSGFFTASDKKGDGKWTWELSNVNKPIEIKAPANCESAAGGLPVMADATEKSTMGDMISYKTAGKLADVVDFYKKEMVAAGWKAGEDGLTTDEMASLEFTKDTQTATLIVTTDSGATSVMITVQK